MRIRCYVSTRKPNDCEEDSHLMCIKNIKWGQKKLLIDEKECQEFVWALKQFRPYFKEKSVRLVIDHRVLEHLTTGKVLFARMIRWTPRIKELIIIVHQLDETNFVVDCISRIPQPEPEEVKNCHMYHINFLSSKLK